MGRPPPVALASNLDCGKVLCQGSGCVRIVDDESKKQIVEVRGDRQMTHKAAEIDERLTTTIRMAEDVQAAFTPEIRRHLGTSGMTRLAKAVDSAAIAVENVKLEFER